MDPNPIHVIVDSTPSSFLSELVPILAVLIAFLLGLLANWLPRHLKRPKLKLEFKGEEEDFVAHSFDSVSGNPCVNIRVKACNKGRTSARGCRAFLTNVEIQEIEGKPGKKACCDSIQLRWSCQPAGLGGFDPLDIPPKAVNQYIDLIAFSHRQEEFLPSIRVLLNRDLWMWKVKGTFVFTIFLYAENAEPVSCKVVFKRKGAWDGENDNMSFEAFSYAEYIRESKQ